jgi:hypothetical protein
MMRYRRQPRRGSGSAWRPAMNQTMQETTLRPVLKAPISTPFLLSTHRTGSPTSPTPAILQSTLPHLAFRCSQPTKTGAMPHSTAPPWPPPMLQDCCYLEMSARMERRLVIRMVIPIPLLIGNNRFAGYRSGTRPDKDHSQNFHHFLRPSLDA